MMGSRSNTVAHAIAQVMMFPLVEKIVAGISPARIRLHLDLGWHRLIPLGALRVRIPPHDVSIPNRNGGSLVQWGSLTIRNVVRLYWGWGGDHQGRGRGQGTSSSIPPPHPCNSKGGAGVQMARAGARGSIVCYGNPVPTRHTSNGLSQSKSVHEGPPQDEQARAAVVCGLCRGSDVPADGMAGTNHGYFYNTVRTVLSAAIGSELITTP